MRVSYLYLPLLPSYLFFSIIFSILLSPHVSIDVSTRPYSPYSHNHTHFAHAHNMSHSHAPRRTELQAISHLIRYPGDLKALKVINGTYYMSGSSHGLSNRIGGVAAALYSAAQKNMSVVVFVWPSTYLDPFYQLFDVIPRLIIIDESLAPIYLSGAKFVSACYLTESCWSMKWAVDPTYKYFDKSPDDFALTTAQTYSLFQLSEENSKIVEIFVKTENICAAHAIHIRRTDMLDYKTSDEDFLQHIASKPQKDKIFILTDNNQTREWFREKIGRERVITFGSFRGPIEGGTSRHTSEVMAIIEVMIASFASTFKGTVPSTFSELVDIFRRVNIITKRREKMCGTVGINGES